MTGQSSAHMTYEADLVLGNINHNMSDNQLAAQEKSTFWSSHVPATARSAIS